MAGQQHLSGIVTVIPSTTSKCGLVVLPGTEPSVPEPGGIWYDAALDCLAYYAPDGTTTYLPKGCGTSGQLLKSNGDAVPTWETPMPELTIGGSDKQVQYNNNGALGGIDNGNAGDVLVSGGAGAVPSFVPYRPRIVQTISDEVKTDSILATQLYTPVETFESIEISYEISTYPTLAGVGTVTLTFRWVDLTQDYSFTSPTLDLSGYVVVAGSFLARADSNTPMTYETAYASAGSVPYNVRIAAKRVA